MSRQTLSQLTGMSTFSISRFEIEGHLSDTEASFPNWLDELRGALEEAGVEFTDKSGGAASVRLRKPEK